MNNDDERQTLPLQWRKWEVLVKTVAAVYIPVLVWYASGRVEQTRQEKQTQADYVELAVQVLSKKVDEKSEAGARLHEWAVQVIEAYSPIPLPEDAAKGFQELGSTPR